jgi:lipopolysaccharide exporter
VAGDEHRGELLATRSSDFLIGKASGAYALGVYSVSYEIANLPTTDLVAPINRAMLPGYAKQVGHSGLLAATYIEVIGLVALAVAPAAFGIAAVANLMVPVLLGSRWLDAGPVMATLAFFGLLLALKSNNHYVYLALGKPRMTTIVGCIQVTILLPMLAWGALTGGALGAALGIVAAEFIFSPISMALVRRELKIAYRALYGPFVRPLVAGAAMYAVVRLFELRVLSGSNVPEIGALVSSVAVGALVYPAAIVTLWWAAGRPASAERHVLVFARTQLWPRLRDWRFVHR